MMYPARMRNALAIALLLLAGCDDAPGEWAAVSIPIEPTEPGST